MTITDRLNDSIELTSPSGSIFTAKWAGDPRTMQKKVGLFNFPKVVGTKGQDLGVSSDSYPLTLYFDGENNDKEADSFWQSLKETGKWEVVHPLYGALFLQLIGEVRQEIDPINSLDFTTFNTIWIETLPDGTEISFAQLSSDVEEQGFLANAAAALQFADNVKTDTFAKIGAVTNAVGSVTNAVKKTIRIVENFDIIPDNIEALIRGIESTLASIPPDTTALAGQMQSLIQISVLGQNNVDDSTEIYNKFTKSINEIKPEVPNEKGLNTAAVQELALSAALVAIGQSALLSGNETRSQAVQSAQAVFDYFDAMTATLDITQELYKNEPLEFQFFSQSGSYSASHRLAALAAQFLLVNAVNLKIERRFKLEVPRNFIEICATEYRNIEDATLDYFIETNELKSHEIRILPALKEIIIYVP